MQRVAVAALTYFALAFAAGFVLGTVRVLALEPAVGALGAVAVELPAMLAISWFASAFTVRRFAVPATSGPRLVMGGAALVLLLAAETVLGIVGFGRTLAEQAASYGRPEAALGLLGQLAFALFPFAQGPSAGRASGSAAR